MNDKEILAYCKNIVLNNLRYYSDRPEVVVEIVELQDKKVDKERLLGHFKGLKELLDRAIKILEEEK